MPLKINRIPQSYLDKQQNALSLTRSEDWSLAEEKINACLQMNPDDWDLLNALSVVYMKTERTEEAIKILLKGVKNAPKKRDFLHNLAFIYLQQKKYSEALSLALQSLLLEPDNPQVIRTVQRARDAALKEIRLHRNKKTDGGNRRSDESAQLKTDIARADEILERIRNSKDKKTPRLSVTMIVRNEEEWLRDCLKSVMDAADEIVVVDTGCTDHTMDIAREFEAVCIKSEWKQDFSEARNAALAHATGDWILWIDADERLEKGQLNQLKSLINDTHPEVGGYLLNIRNFMGDKKNPDIYWHRAVRLFRKLPETRFVGRIHEQVMPSLEKAGYVFTRCQLNLDHYGYLTEMMDERNKHERFITMLNRDIDDENLIDLRPLNMFNLGNAHYVAGNAEEAVRWFIEGAACGNPKEEYMQSLYANWASALYRSGQYEEVLKVAARAEELGIHSSSTFFMKGHAFLIQGQLNEAEKSFQSALKQTSALSFTPVGDESTTGYKSNFGLALVSQARKNFAATEKYCRLALQEKPDFCDGLYFLAEALVYMKRLPEALPYLDKLLQLTPDHTAALALYGITLYELHDYLGAITHLRKSAAKDPQNAEVVVRLAACTERMAIYDEALKIYLQAVTLRPDSANLHTNLGRMYAMFGQEAQALECFARAIELDPSNANTFFNAADVLYRLGEYIKCAEFLGEGIQRNPNHANGYFVLGNCFFQLREYEPARLAWNQALALRPDYPEAASNLLLIDDMETEELRAAS
jgi:tetratricopeptide (TPR) repeat protein